MSRMDELKSIYFPNEVDIDSELFAPVAKESESLDCMVGYFTSGSLGELAQSLSCYLRISSERKMQFIVSPNFAADDIASIKSALEMDKNLLPLLFPDYEISEESLRRNCLDALCYLIASNKLILKVALQANGLFHSKCWLFRTSQGEVAIHGSGNATASGLAQNFEQLSVSRSWRGSEPAEVCRELRSRFDSIWKDSYAGISCREVTRATIDAIWTIAERLKRGLEDENNLQKELISKLSESTSHPEVQRQTLKVPDWLDYSDGPYAHQGKAVEAWNRNNRTGILAIATGGGKTLTSLVAAALLSGESKRLIVVIAVPTKPLMNQWLDDVKKFGAIPISGYNKTRQAFKGEVKQAIRRIRHDVSKVEVIIVTHDGIKSDVLSDVERYSDEVPALLIADEVHNLGSAGFMNNPPTYFKYKIGLSATHERQFDELGSNFLTDYFGGVVFEYSLGEAIGQCLVPYEYYAHEVILTAEEEEEFCLLTFEIRKLAYAADLDEGSSAKARWKALCLKRRRLIEAAENKVVVLQELLPQRKHDVTKSLIFCTDKYPEQIKEVNQLLDSRSINYHQVTQEETSDPRLLGKIIADFTSGRMQVLTSKRVLDEGFNVPQVETAFLLASNTVRRQWIQRLGRVLRMSPSTGKTRAIIHDFLVLPPSMEGNMDKELESLIQSEYGRLSFFSELSSNGLERGGSMYLKKRLLDIMRGK